MKSFFKPLYLIFIFVATFGLQLSAQKSPYGKASYDLKSTTYLKQWWIAGPVMISTGTELPDQSVQEKFFDEDPVKLVQFNAGKAVAISTGGKSFEWKYVSEKGDVVDFNKLYTNIDYAAAYAVAEIKADAPAKIFLSVGSDDAIKIWHNGKEVHRNWAARGLTLDEDLVPISLEKGSNQILVKVQDIAGDWVFSARILDKSVLSARLITTSGRGNLDEVKMLLDAGADVNHVGKTGLTPLSAAQMRGREEVANFLKEKGANPQSAPSPEKLIEGLYGRLNEKPSPGVSVLVGQNGKIIYERGFGLADVENKVKVTPETKFRIGSITKQFTASAILKLQEQGKISVNDKLSKFFPDFPRANEVSVHQLLTHTSGIHSYTDKPEFMDKVTKPISSDELVRFFKDDPYDFNPGEQWRYNNSAYFLLGMIIEKVSGKTYEQFLKETFFTPLQMNNTGIHTATAKLSNEAKGYQKSDEKYTATINWDMSWAGGAGAMYSTVEDLFKWNEAMFDGKVLNEASMKAAFTPVLLSNGQLPQGVKYGYGWGLGEYRGLDQIQHSGGLHGFISQLLRVPKENLTVVLLTNISPPEVNLNPMEVGEYFVWDKMEKQSSFEVQSVAGADLKSYEGRYDFGNSAVMTITSEGDKLFARLTGQSRFEIFPSAPDQYFWKVVDAKIKFVRNDKGQVTHGEFEQSGRKLTIPKMTEIVVASIDPKVYKDYTGKYDYGNNFFISITTENDKIYAQGSNQPRLEMFPVSETEFSLKELNARIIFVREADRKVSKLTLDMAGQKKDAPKVE
jgi:CubicO group peptidase (beta-lactamase class C family)